MLCARWVEETTQDGVFSLEGSHVDGLHMTVLMLPTEIRLSVAGDVPVWWVCWTHREVEVGIGSGFGGLQTELLVRLNTQ